MNQEELNKIERKRKTAQSAIQKINITIGILFISNIAFFIGSVTHNLDPINFFIALFITIPLVTVLVFAKNDIENKINKEIFKVAYEPIFKEKNTEFNHNDGITLNEIMSSNLFQKPDRFTTNNLTKGEISNFPYKASNITLLKEQTETDNDGNSNTYTTTIFNGRMYIIETPFNKKGIILSPRKIGEKKLLDNTKFIITLIISLTIIGTLISNIYGALSFFIIFIATLIIMATWLFLSNRKNKYQEAKLESSQFNKYFYIETTDQIELRKTLTPAIMEKLINLRNSIGEFHLSIIGNRIFFAFPESFYLKYDKPVQDLIQETKELVEKEIETIKSIIETLKLEEEKIKKGIINK